MFRLYHDTRVFMFCKQKTAYEMRISDWSSDVCSSDLSLSKRYGDHLVFQGLAHSFPPGCVALCEEDSTGKSSLLDIIAGVMAPDAGAIGKESGREGVCQYV